MRGVNPYPGAWCQIILDGQIKRLKVYRTLSLDTQEYHQGQFALLNKQRVVVGCEKGALELLEVQLEGEKENECRRVCSRHASSVFYLEKCQLIFSSGQRNLFVRLLTKPFFC